MGALIDLSLPLAGDESDWRFSFPAMGTRIDVAGRGGNPAAIARDSCALVAELESLWSVFRSDSDVSRINASADWCPVDRRSDALLRDAVELSEASGGAFSPLVGALVELRGLKGARSVGTGSARKAPTPSEEELERAVRACDPSRLRRDPRGRWRIAGDEGPRPRLDLGGIAKGATADLLRDAAAGAGAEGVLVSVGTSSIAVHGSRRDGAAWRVGLRDPEGAEDSWGSRVDLARGSLSTSGTLVPGAAAPSARHLLDPRSGRFASSGIHQATVMCASGVLAEALSTALVVGGADCVDGEAVRRWAQERGIEPGWEFVLMTSEGPVPSGGAPWSPRSA